MAAMRAVGNSHRLPAHANVREDPCEYLIELDVSDFTESELTVEALGPRLTVRGDQQATAEDDSRPFRLRERLEESFRLPDDADADQIKVFYKHGTLQIASPLADRASVLHGQRRRDCLLRGGDMATSRMPVGVRID
jgi:HSP20 family molecular chaperone IbpA